jgi:E3 ubiquitin-protein ligase TRIP12
MPLKLTNGRNFWPTTVRRAHLLEDGITLLREIGPGSLALDLAFDSENGFGSGPTHEFCDLFSKELCTKALGLWRNSDFNNENPFAFAKTGLFPRPGANAELFRILGILCGKAIAMNIVLPIPLSVAFFKLVGGEPIALSEVDPELDASLKNREGILGAGLTFVYAGIESIELIPNGEKIQVTAENYDQYVELVTQVTLDLPEIRDKFNEGLFSVMESGIWRRLRAEEKLANVIGEQVELTMALLESHFRFAHGYDTRSAHKTMLLEIILDFTPRELKSFLKFVTGCEALPIGGLAGLQPRITVARRISEEEQVVDGTLPTVATCTHYFKLPPYSSKEVMRGKILYAITEGQEFHLS